MNKFKRNIYLLYITKFLRFLHFFGAVSIPFFKDWVHFSYTRIFILQATFSLGVFIFEIPTGVIADRYGRKLSLILGTIVAMMGFAVYGTSRDFYSFILADLLLALSATLFSGADKALIYDSLIQTNDEEKSRYIFSKYESLGNAGVMIGLVSGSFFAQSGIIPYPESLRYTFLICVIPYLLILFLNLFIKEPPVLKKVESNFLKAGLDGFLFIFQKKGLTRLALNFAFISSTTFFMFWFYQSLGLKFGIPVKYNGVIGAGFNLFTIILLLNLKSIERFLGLTKALLLTAILPGLLYVALAFNNNTIFILICIYLITGSKMLRRPVLVDFMNKHIESSNRATVLSGVSMLDRILITILYPIVGYITDIKLEYAFLFLGITSLVFALVTRIRESRD